MKKLLSALGIALLVSACSATIKEPDILQDNKFAVVTSPVKNILGCTKLTNIEQIVFHTKNKDIAKAKNILLSNQDDCLFLIGSLDSTFVVVDSVTNFTKVYIPSNVMYPTLGVRYYWIETEILLPVNTVMQIHEFYQKSNQDETAKAETMNKFLDVVKLFEKSIEGRYDKK